MRSAHALGGRPGSERAAPGSPRGHGVRGSLASIARAAAP